MYRVPSSQLQIRPILCKFGRFCANSADFVKILMIHAKTSHLRHAAGITHVEVDFPGIWIVKDGVSACTADQTETCAEWMNKPKNANRGMAKCLT